MYKMITKKFCPQCGSEDVYMMAGGITGSWMCKKCGHQGPVLEKEIFDSEKELVGSKKDEGDGEQ